MTNLEHSLLCVWLLCIVALVTLLNVRGIARWVGNKIADLLGGSPKW